MFAVNKKLTKISLNKVISWERKPSGCKSEMFSGASILK